jgi:16S rRNA C967 or C1407 C5-methylase (RsmB/RsmF family)
MVRPGGKVVYATCTLAPEENEHVVSRVLAREPVCLRPIDLASPAVLGGLTQWGASAYDEQVQQACRLLPCTDGFTGFFVALLERT